MKRNNKVLQTIISQYCYFKENFHFRLFDCDFTYVGFSVVTGVGSSFSCSIMRKLFTFSSISSAEYLTIQIKRDFENEQ